ncbi:hypothetical protein ACO0LG_22660 [Undibacterium sp. Ji42W]|uniref:hypothetical protein n=1 Tax=Undibacterium sp. Ji42W TaxID=3413039 RepID=UPI003BF1E29F
MSGDKSTEYEVSANPGPFVAGMEKVQTSAQKTAKDIESSFKAIEGSMQQVGNAFKSVTSLFGTLTAVIAGGKAFKEIIGASNEWTGEAKKLSMQLGITTERASVAMVAMRHMGLDSEMVSMAAGKMAKQIATNGHAFETLGVKVKDANGEYRPTLDIMGEVNAKLKDIKNPIEQNIAGTQAYGKSWNDVKATLKLTTEEIAKAEQKTKDMGLLVGEEAVAQTKKYKESINDMKLIMTSLEVQMGNALLPAFVKIGGWLSNVGPAVGKAMGLVMESLGNIMETVGDVVMDLWGMCKSGFAEIGNIVSEVMGGSAPGAMEIFGNALKVIEIAFVAFKTAINLVIEIIKGYIEILVVHAMRMADTVDKALHGDFSGAKAAWQRGTQDIEDIAARHAKKMVEIASAGKDKIDDIVMRGPKAQPEIKDKKITGGPTYDFSGPDKDAKAKSRMHEWEAKLGADKDGYAKEQELAGTAHEFSHAMELAYWKRVLDTVKMSKEERAQVEKKYYAEKALIRKEAFEAEMAGEKSNLENFKHNHVERLAIAERMYKANVARYGAESKEARAAYADINKEHRAMAEQQLSTNKVIGESSRNAALAGIDAEEQAAEFELATHRLTAEELLQLQEGYENRRYQIKLQALQEQEKLMHGPDEDPVALAQMHLQMESLEQQHQQRLSMIKDKAAKEERKNIDGMYTSIKSGIASVISQTLHGTLTLKGMLTGMFQAVTNAIIDMLAKQAAEIAMDFAMKRILGKAGAVSAVTANAAVTGSAAFASIAAIPIIGPAMAPAAAAAAMAGAMSFVPIAASAAGGYDIPGGLNPVVQTHAREMILPAKYADLIRSMSDQGAGGNTNTGHTINYHDNSGRLSQDEIRRNAKTIADVLKDHTKRS